VNHKKATRILAIVALVFMGIFTVSLVVFFAANSWTGGEQPVVAAISAVVLAVSGILGIGLFFLVKALTREPKNPMVPPPDEGGSSPPDEEPQ